MGWNARSQRKGHQKDLLDEVREGTLTLTERGCTRLPAASGGRKRRRFTGEPDSPDGRTELTPLGAGVGKKKSRREVGRETSSIVTALLPKCYRMLLFCYRIDNLSALADNLSITDLLYVGV